MTSLRRICQEAWPLANMWYFAQRAKSLPKRDDLAFCYGVLTEFLEGGSPDRLAIEQKRIPSEL